VMDEVAFSDKACQGGKACGGGRMNTLESRWLKAVPSTFQDEDLDVSSVTTLNHLML